jgi:hypothetical protein
MQNEPNFSKSQILITSISTMNYNEKPTVDSWSKQTQTKPISSASGGVDSKGQAAWGNVTGEFLSNQGGKRAKFSNFSLKSRSYHD